MDSIAFIGQTDVGLVRTNNEDTFIAQTLWDDRHLVCAAIDGVGGYEGGEVAAEMAKETILKFLSEYRDDDLQSLVSQAVLQANNAIYERRKTDTRFPNMSCVVSAAIIDILNDKLFIAHVGDSRIYLYSNGNLKKLTHDHSLVGYREEIGELTEEEAMNHPHRNIIERCLGERQVLFDNLNGFIDSQQVDIPANGKLVFCSDGLTDLVTSSEIVSILSRDETTETKSQALIDCAKSHGGKDNITVVLVETKTDAVSSGVREIDCTKTEDGSEESPADDGAVDSARKRNPFIPSLISLFAGLILGLLAGFIFWGNRGAVSSDQTGQPAGTLPVAETDSLARQNPDSMMVSVADYRRLSSFDEVFPIVQKMNSDLSRENDSLRREISVRDSLRISPFFPTWGYEYQHFGF